MNFFLSWRSTKRPARIELHRFQVTQFTRWSTKAQYSFVCVFSLSCLSSWLPGASILELDINFWSTYLKKNYFIHTAWVDLLKSVNSFLELFNHFMVDCSLSNIVLLITWSEHIGARHHLLNLNLPREKSVNIFLSRLFTINGFTLSNFEKF